MGKKFNKCVESGKNPKTGRKLENDVGKKFGVLTKIFTLVLFFKIAICNPTIAKEYILRLKGDISVSVKKYENLYKS